MASVVINITRVTCDRCGKVEEVDKDLEWISEIQPFDYKIGSEKGAVDLCTSCNWFVGDALKQAFHELMKVETTGCPKSQSAEDATEDADSYEMKCKAWCKENGISRKWIGDLSSGPETYAEAKKRATAGIKIGELKQGEVVTQEMLAAMVQNAVNVAFFKVENLVDETMDADATRYSAMKEKPVVERTETQWRLFEDWLKLGRERGYVEILPADPRPANRE